MMRLRVGIAIGLALLLSACGTSVPNVTPTVRPSATPTDIPTRIAEQPSRTPLILLTDTPTLTQTSTATLLLTQTASQTATATATNTGPLTPSNTPTLTRTVTNTPIPTVIGPLAPSMTPSLTPLILPGSTGTPTATPTPDLARTRVAQQQATRAALTPTHTPDALATQQAAFRQTLAARRASATPLIGATATRTIAPTLDVTPTFITATPGSASTPVPSTPIAAQPQVTAGGALATRSATPFTPTPIPESLYRPAVVTPVPAPTLGAPTFNNTNLSAFTFGDGGPSTFILSGQSITSDGSVFAPNPVYPDSYARTDALGMIHYETPQGEAGVYTFDPFWPGYWVPTAEENKNFVSAITWSPDGEKFAFIVTPPFPGDTIGAGVYYWQPGGGYRLLYDCPELHVWSSCSLVRNPLPEHISQQLEWSPDSNRLLVSLDLPRLDRGGLVVVEALPIDSYDDSAPPIIGYDSGSWLGPDTILVSGRRHNDARVIIGTINYPFGNYDSLNEALLNERILYDGSVNNTWVQDAVMRPNGQIVTLCKRGLSNGGPDNRPLRLCALQNGALVELTGDIGDAQPQVVSWSADRNIVVLQISGQQYSVAVDAQQVAPVSTAQTIQLGNTRISQSVNISGTGSAGVAPIGVREPANNGSDTVAPPDGVIAGSRYQPGQQVQYIGGANRNLRDLPNLSTSTVIGYVAPDEFVAILAGPHTSNDFTWWLVSTARDQQGWLAAEFGGTSLLSP